MKKALGIILVLAMLLSVVPALNVAAADETTWTKVDSLADIGDKTFAITIESGGKTYVLPAYNTNASATNVLKIPVITGEVNEAKNTLTTSNTDISISWVLSPSAKENEYYIKDATEGSKLYLGTFANNNGNGVLIYGKNNPAEDQRLSVKLLPCGLLGSLNSKTDATAMSALCVADGMWKAYKLDDAASTDKPAAAADNVLGLWVLGAPHDCVDADPKDHLCDTCGAELTTCGDADPLDHLCDTCGKELTTCEDAPTDGDHKCDTCGKDDVTKHADTDGDKRCDDCTAAMCEGDHPDENPKDHICDVCGGVVSSCVDEEPKDHDCDICGEAMSECEDAEDDDDHLCDTCGAEGITDCTDAAGDGDHKCDVCEAEDITDHTWAEATIEAPKTCTECGLTEGEPLPLSPTPEGSHWTKVTDLADIGEGEKLAITITIDGVTYILPNAKVKDAASAPTTDTQAAISEDGRFLTVESGHRGYNWTVVPTEGGYYIMSGNMYLWVDNGMEGLRITETDAPTAWYVHDVCKLLCSVDATSGKTRSMCVKEGLWHSYEINNQGKAHSSVRNNVLGLWKYVPAADESPETGDSTVSVMIAMMVVSAMGVVALVSKKKF